ncbi:MAG: hypothetical protein AB7S48_09275 [Bacteroidales bacterium]
MNTPDELFDRIKDILGSSPENMSILEDIVSIDVQVEYYERVAELRCAEPINSYSSDDLLSNRLSANEVQDFLIQLAGTDEVENYRLIEKYVASAPEELKEWGLMALNESRFHLVSSLSDDSGVFISTGLGGKDGKLRYFVVFVPRNSDFSNEHVKLVVDEVNFIFPRYMSVVEQIEILDCFVCVTALIPMGVAVNEPIKAVVDECLSLGCLLSDGYIVTNVKQLSLDEIQKVLNHEPVDGMPFEEQ